MDGSLSKMVPQTPGPNITAISGCPCGWSNLVSKSVKADKWTRKAKAVQSAIGSIFKVN